MSRVPTLSRQVAQSWRSKSILQLREEPSTGGSFSWASQAAWCNHRRCCLYHSMNRKDSAWPISIVSSLCHVALSYVKCYRVGPRVGEVPIDKCETLIRYLPDEESQEVRLTPHRCLVGHLQRHIVRGWACRLVALVDGGFVHKWPWRVRVRPRCDWNWSG